VIASNDVWSAVFLVMPPDGLMGHVARDGFGRKNPTSAATRFWLLVTEQRSSWRAISGSAAKFRLLTTLIALHKRKSIKTYLDCHRLPKKNQPTRRSVKSRNIFQ